MVRTVPKIIPPQTESPLRRNTITLLLLALTGCPGEAKFKYLDAALDQGPGDISAQDQGADLAAGQAGGACPCNAGLTCISKICRRKCNKQQCNGSGGCGPGEACVVSGPQKIPICLAAVGQGKVCAADTYCKAGTICLSDNPKVSTGRCFLTCQNKGSKCSSGGMCYAMPSGGCLYCYP